MEEQEEVDLINVQFQAFAKLFEYTARRFSMTVHHDEARRTVSLRRIKTRATAFVFEATGPMTGTILPRSKNPAVLRGTNSRQVGTPWFTGLTDGAVSRRRRNS
jgi:hypothetical protein